MKYTVSDNNGCELSFNTEGSTQDTVRLATDDRDFYFTPDAFKDFRKAVGFVWQEVHDD